MGVWAGDTRPNTHNFLLNCVTPNLYVIIDIQIIILKHSCECRLGLWESPWKKGYVGVVCGRSPQTTPTYGPYHGRSQRDCRFILGLGMAFSRMGFGVGKSRAFDFEKAMLAWGVARTLMSTSWGIPGHLQISATGCWAKRSRFTSCFWPPGRPPGWRNRGWVDQHRSRSRSCRDFQICGRSRKTGGLLTLLPIRPPAGRL